MVRVVEAWQQPTHRFFRNGYVYLVANSVIDVAQACVLDVKQVEVKNGYRWDKYQEETRN